MAKENITPEEKLLKIIENPDVEKGRISARAIKRKIGGLAAVSAWFKGVRIDKDALRYLDLRTANKIAAVLGVFFTIFWIYDFLNVGERSKSALAEIRTSPAISEEANTALLLPEARLENILSETKKRNIFTLLPPKEETPKDLGAAGVVSTLKLVGILWSDNPQAMIESTKDQKTYLLNTGESIGDIKIKTIFRNRVILNQGDQEWELR